MIDFTNWRLRLRQTMLWLFFSQIVFVLFLGLYLVFFSGPLAIGVGKFQETLHTIESTDFRLWFLGLLFLYFLGLFVALFFLTRLDTSSWQLEQLRATLYALIKDKSIPVRVDINEMISVTMDRPVRAPFLVDTGIDLNEEVFIKANIPIDLTLPIDTIVETSVLGVGKIKIPIKTILPVKMNFPFEGKVHMRVDQFRLRLNEMAEVNLPTLSVPVNCQVNARLNLESNLQQMEEIIKNKKPRERTFFE